MSDYTHPNEKLVFFTFLDVYLDVKKSEYIAD